MAAGVLSGPRIDVKLFDLGPSMSVLEEIVSWSKTRAAWQRDAIRRIILGEDIGDAELAELANLCLREFDLAKPIEGLNPEPVTEAHIANLTPAARTVTLKSISDVKHVNALAPGNTLEFALTGMTAIYGDNGAGKSGYGRLLKCVSRSRSKKSPIHPNVFAPRPAEPSAATFTFSVDGADRTHGWTEKAETPPELRQVSFFDSGALTQYVENRSNVAYRPFGLDVLPKLVKVCDHIRAFLGPSIERLRESTEFAGFRDETAASKFIKSLSSASTFVDVDAACSALAPTEEKIIELKSAISALDTNSVKLRGGELKLKAKRFRSFAMSLTSIASALSSERLDELRQAKVRLANSGAAKAASLALLAEEPLSGIGSDTWETLWKAARKYSAAFAYPGEKFPVSTAGARCVLCQQPLSDDGSERMKRLDAFVDQEVQKEAEDAKTSFDESKQSVERLVVPSADKCDEMSELFELDRALHQSVTDFLDGMQKRRAAVLDACGPSNWPLFYAPSASPAAAVEGFAVLIEAQAKKVEGTSEPEEEKRLRKELDELLDHQLLVKNKDGIEKEIIRKRLRDRYENCHSSADTNAITRKNTEMTREVLTEGLRKAFEEELAALNLGHLSVDVVDQGGQKGEMTYQLELRGKQIADAKAADVLSEGEHRCIALAAFLTELSMQTSKSTIVLDDPVCSLDHRCREAVARRLAKVAIGRPVVVLTHDVVFLLNLSEAAIREKVGFAGKLLDTRGAERGIPVDGLPWKGMSVQKRIGWLKAELQSLEGVYKKEPRERYEPLASLLWGRLREAWECGVEEVLLNESVLRFGRGISTERLKKLHDITPADIEMVKSEMGEASKWIAGHTEAPGLNAPMPDPKAIAAAIDRLDAWCKAIVKRR